MLVLRVFACQVGRSRKSFLVSRDIACDKLLHALFSSLRAVQNAAVRTQTLVLERGKVLLKRRDFRWRLVPLVDLFMHVEVYVKSVPSVDLFFCGAGNFVECNGIFLVFTAKLSPKSCKCDSTMTQASTVLLSVCARISETKSSFHSDCLIRLCKYLFIVVCVENPESQLASFFAE